MGPIIKTMIIKIYHYYYVPAICGYSNQFYLTGKLTFILTENSGYEWQRNYIIQPVHLYPR